MVWWEVILLVAATTATVVIGQDPDDWGINQLPKRDEVDVTGYLNSEMEGILEQWASIEERGNRCTPTFLCTHAGGYCVKKSQDCNGTVDPSGCKGKKCKCCIPENIICGPTPVTLAPTTLPSTNTSGYKAHQPGKFWPSSQCTKLSGLLIASSLASCIELCNRHPMCTAIHYNSNCSLNECRLLDCDVPAPEPAGTADGWIGYSKV